MIKVKHRVYCKSIYFYCFNLLLELFCYENSEDDQNTIRSLKEYVLEDGYYPANDITVEGALVLADHDDEFCPAFQFNVGSKVSLAIVKEINRVLLAETLTPWEVAIWWHTTNGYVDGHTPLEVMSSEEFRKHLWEAVRKETGKISEDTAIDSRY